MPRQKRTEFYGAIYCVTVQGRRDDSIFFERDILGGTVAEALRAAPNLPFLEQLLEEITDECGAVVHAFMFAPNVGFLVLQMYSVPLRSFMARFSGRFSRFLHRQGRLPETRPAFRDRYRAEIITPGSLQQKIREVEALPMALGLWRCITEYPFSSALRLGLSVPCGLSDLNRGSHIESGISRKCTGGAHAAAAGRRVIGSPSQTGSQAYPTQWHPPQRDTIVDAVTRLLSSAALPKHLRGRLSLLERSLVTRYAIRSGTATLREIAGWYGVTPAALSGGIARFRRLVPELFCESLTSPAAEERGRTGRKINAVD